jgi:hypothetical protein
MLSEGASGLRHLRWTREILASLEAYAAGEGLIEQVEREALREEAARLRELVQKLSGAVKAYRDFLERTRVGLRGKQRVARFAYDEARRRAEAWAKTSMANAPELSAAIELSAARLDASKDALARIDAETRRPLKAALRAVITEVRAALEAMNARLSASFPVDLLGSLYPPLAQGGTIVAHDEDEDEDDDASARSSD